MVVLTLDEGTQTAEAVSFSWGREMEPSDIKEGKLVTVRGRLLVVLIVDQRELRVMDTRTRKAEQVSFSRPFDELYLKDANLILKASWGSYVLEYISLRFPFKYELALQFYAGEYLVERGAKGVAVFMPFAQFAGAPSQKVASMEDYTNNFLFFHSRDYTIQLNEMSELTPLNFFKKVKRKISLKRRVEETSYEPVSERGGDTARTEAGARGSFKSTIREVQQSSREFYLSVRKCGTNELILMLMHHFSTFDEMNHHLGKKRFMAALATHVSNEEAS